MSIRDFFHRRILKTQVNIVGCGRTDAQVHAAQFFFHVDLDASWDFDLKFRFNKNLPDDIAIFHIIPMEGTEHARLDAMQRIVEKSSWHSPNLR